MRVGIHASYSEPEKLIAYCRAVGVQDICLSCSSLPGYREHGYPGLDVLKSFRRQLGEAGVTISAMIAPLPSEEAVRGEPGSEEEVGKLRKSIEVMGESGARTALFYPFDRTLFSRRLLGEPYSRRLGSQGRYEKALRLGPEFDDWQAVVEFYQAVVDAAEKADVRLANHVWDVSLMDAVFRAVPSHHNGMQYCPGMYIIGGDPYAAVEHWGSNRIYLAHARNLVKHGEDFKDYEEVFLDRGDVDIARCVRLLKGIGYEGVIIPEHLGEKPGEDLTPKAVQWLKQLL
ncbi:MAG: TIM barrel protein [Candidatus Bathyarchaeia archaeon]